MTRLLSYAAFLAGLISVAWVGAGYLGSHGLALAVTLLIGAFYLMGALELRRFQQATDALAQVLADTPSPPPALGPWLERLPPSLRNAVRLRVHGERVGLPGPALTPYLAGLLVLLGMLGTFVGMVVTLNGTGLALESASDLQAIRASLAAPVKGLGVAFGTSLAGIATSAMLGLLAALCRSERLRAGQLLDALAATTLRGFSVAHQRDESLRLQQRQAEVLPALADRLQAMMAAMEQQSLALHERLASGQEAFNTRTEAAYKGLASAVDHSLKESLSESARLAGSAIQPFVEATMAGVAREATALHHTVAEHVQRQLDGVAERFASTSALVGEQWNAALATQREANATASAELRGTLATFTDTFTERSATLVDSVSARLAGTSDSLASRWHETLLQHEQATQALSAETQQALAGTASRFEQHAGALLRTVEQAHTAQQADASARDTERLTVWSDVLAQHERTSLALTSDAQQALAATATRFEQHAAALQRQAEQAHAELHAQLRERDDQRIAAWTQALAQHERTSLALSTDTQQALASTTAGFAQHAAELQRGVERAHADLQTHVAQRDDERLTAWTASLAGMAASLREAWELAGAQAASQQQHICETLSETARAITSQAETQARSTIAEIGQLLEAAAQAPRAAAEVIAELRAKLSDSLVHDNAVLEERTRVLETLRTLLDSVNHAATGQRTAIDALVGDSADLLARIGARFAERVDAEAGKLDAVAAQLTGSAVEVASLGESFGMAVQVFSESNDKLSLQLQRIEGALGKSIARSDEQLGYYVAQAREVVDLSILSQKQIVEDLQRLSRNQSAVGTEA